MKTERTERATERGTERVNPLKIWETERTERASARVQARTRRRVRRRACACLQARGRARPRAHYPVRPFGLGKNQGLNPFVLAFGDPFARSVAA
jgi:hypothetical protein